MYMKKSVLHFFKVLIAGLVLLCLSSCTGLIQKTGSVSVEIGPELMNAAREGGELDEEFVRIVVALEGNRYGIKQTVDIPMEQYWDSMDTDRRFEATFDNIPVGKKLYAVIKTYQMMPGNNLPLELRDPELYGKSDYFTVKAGQNKVSINASDYIRLNPYAYNNTPVVSYNYNKDNYKYNYTIDRSNGVTSTSASFCFDDEGNVYSIDNNSIVANSHMGLLPLTGFYPQGITFDNATKKIYIYAFNEATLKLCDVTDVVTEWDSTQFDNSNVKDINFSETGNDLSNFYHKIVTVKNGILYDIGRNNYGSGNIFLVTKDINNISSLETIADSIIALSDRLNEQNVNFIIDNEQFKITVSINDMLFIDGALYVLISEKGNRISTNGAQVNNFSYISRGAIVKYTPSEDSIKILGWAAEPLNNSGKYAYAKYGDYLIYEDEAKTKPFRIPADKIVNLYYPTNTELISFPTFYVPNGENDSNHLFGPKRFVAIKPKKLVISDEGLAFYTDNNNAYNSKKVNRMITVDLETFAMSCASTADVFDNESVYDITSSTFVSTSVFVSAGIMDSEHMYYLQNSSEFNLQQSGLKEVKVFIPLQ